MCTLEYIKFSFHWNHAPNVFVENVKEKCFEKTVLIYFDPKYYGVEAHKTVVHTKVKIGTLLQFHYTAIHK